MISEEEAKSEHMRRAARRRRTLALLSNAKHKSAQAKDRALLESVDRGDVEECARLLLEGANANYQGYRSSTPLHHAAKPELAELLVRHGAYVNVMTAPGLSAESYSGGTLSMGGNTALHLGEQFCWINPLNYSMC